MYCYKLEPNMGYGTLKVVYAVQQAMIDSGGSRSAPRKFPSKNGQAKQTLYWMHLRHGRLEEASADVLLSFFLFFSFLMSPVGA